MTDPFACRFDVFCVVERPTRPLTQAICSSLRKVEGKTAEASSGPAGPARL
ncbi:hypothetical protein [Bosea sp. (in: a-proteobacteria)]|uniref:hypothetical protein n=1 Tax=Bosea sp. (in: a-proteobacteria) TaxID=1871050 RepID=UPI004034F1C4